MFLCDSHRSYTSWWYVPARAMQYGVLHDHQPPLENNDDPPLAGTNLGDVASQVFGSGPAHLGKWIVLGIVMPTKILTTLGRWACGAPLNRQAMLRASIYLALFCPICSRQILHSQFL